VDPTCQGRSCDYCVSDLCTYQVYNQGGVGDAQLNMLAPCY
jgi:hypothetical protein